MVKIFDRPTVWVYRLPGGRSKNRRAYGSYLVDVAGDARYHDFGDCLSQGKRVDRERGVTHCKITGCLLPELANIGWDQDGLSVVADGIRLFGNFYSRRGYSLFYSHDRWPGISAGYRYGIYHRGDIFWQSFAKTTSKKESLTGCQIIDNDYKPGARILCRVAPSMHSYQSTTDPEFFSDLSKSTLEEETRPYSMSSSETVRPLSISWVRSLLLTVREFPALNDSVVTARAVDKIGAGVPNFYESMPGFAGLQGQINDTVSAFNSVLARTAGPKDLAGQYLSYLYGYRQIPDEIKAVMDDVRRLSTAGDTLRRVLRAGDSDATNFGRTKVYRSAFAKVAFSPVDNPLANWYRSMIDSGWAPTVENWWETVPFSFVVDWFTNIGDNFSHMSTKARWSTYRVHSLCVSNKWEAHVPVVGAGVTGFLSDKRYTRRVSDELPEYDFSFISNLSPQRHAVEAAALLVVNN